MNPRPAAFLAPLALGASLAAQPLNCRMLAHVDKFPGAINPYHNYTGCWGMVCSNGREYALVAARTGTIIYDCQNPQAPVEVAFVPGPAPTTGLFFWREIRELGGYVYVSSEYGPVQVIDMRAPGTPVLVGTFGSTAHALALDVQRKHLWVIGGSGYGAVIHDLNVSPTNPPAKWAYPPQIAPTYVHDAFVQGGWAYLSTPYEGKLRIVDVTNLNAMSLASATATPGAFTHSAWADEENKICVVTDENHGGCLSVYDVTNKAAPVLLSTWCSPTAPAATLHYQYLVDKVVHVASYADGYWAIDISVPTSPKAIAHFDTNPLTLSDYVGAWGCYPMQPSGVVYISDMQTGFWIVEPTCGVPRLYGKGTPGKGGFVPRIEHGGGIPQVNNAAFAMLGRTMRGGAPAALLLGMGAATLPVVGIDLAIDLNKPFIVLPVTANGQVGVAGDGRTSQPLPLANQPSLANAPVYAQWLVADPDAPGGILSASRGFLVTICP